MLMMGLRLRSTRGAATAASTKSLQNIPATAILNPGTSEVNVVTRQP
jgi:hypothetical protein